MYYNCEISDKKIRFYVKDKHFESNCHTFFELFTIIRWFTEKPNINIFTEPHKKLC